mgnify:CR=1 FL=1
MGHGICRPNLFGPRIHHLRGKAGGFNPAPGGFFQATDHVGRPLPSPESLGRVPEDVEQHRRDLQGDPRAIREILDTGLPVFGICLGHQLLGLASGARTLKMKHGHHGANHPVKNLEDGTVMITSQNHGFAVDESSLPDNVRPIHKSLFDGTLQGIERTDKDAFSFQGHPEASPGPHDVAPLFDRFIEAMAKRR